MKTYNASNSKAIKAARIKQLQTYKTIMYIFALSIILASIIFFFIINKKTMVNASENGEYSYISIEIGEGDTIWSIAEDHLDSFPGDINSFISMVRKVNNIDVNSIYSGTSILIPVYITSNK